MQQIKFYGMFETTLYNKTNNFDKMYVSNVSTIRNLLHNLIQKLEILNTYNTF